MALFCTTATDARLPRSDLAAYLSDCPPTIRLHWDKGAIDTPARGHPRISSALLIAWRIRDTSWNGQWSTWRSSRGIERRGPCTERIRAVDFKPLVNMHYDACHHVLRSRVTVHLGNGELPNRALQQFERPRESPWTNILKCQRLPCEGIVLLGDLSLETHRSRPGHSRGATFRTGSEDSAEALLVGPRLTILNSKRPPRRARATLSGSGPCARCGSQGDQSKCWTHGHQLHSGSFRMWASRGRPAVARPPLPRRRVLQHHPVPSTLMPTLWARRAAPRSRFVSCSQHQCPRP